MNRSILSMILVIFWGWGLAACGDGAIEDLQQERDVIYQDDFSSGQLGPWHTEQDEFGKSAIEQGRMTIQVNAPNTVQYTTLREPTFSDFTIITDATLLIGDAESTYGLLFRMLSPSEFYRFEITGDGRYMVERRNADGSWSRLLDEWQTSTAILPGSDVTNRLQVVADGSELSFYVNDVLLSQLTDSTYASGQIALDAGTFGNENTLVAFDQLVVGQP